MGAVAQTKAGRNSSFAIQVPEDGDEFFQLDVHVCKKGCLDWESIMYAYGDLWHIIGSTVSRFGLAIDDSGLHARDEEVEATNRRACLLLLTGEPQEIMEFLGLDSRRYDDGFSTLDELFEWTTSMPLFRRAFFKKGTIGGKQGCIREKRPMYSNLVTEWLPQKTRYMRMPPL